MTRSHCVSSHMTAKTPHITSVQTYTASRHHLSPHFSQCWANFPSNHKLRNLMRPQQCDWDCVLLEVRINSAQGLGLIVVSTWTPPCNFNPPSSIISHRPSPCKRQSCLCLLVGWPASAAFFSLKKPTRDMSLPFYSCLCLRLGYMNEILFVSWRK